MYNNIFSGGFSVSDGWLSGGSTSSTSGFSFGSTTPSSGFDWKSNLKQVGSSVGKGSMSGDAVMGLVGTGLGAAFGSPAIGQMVTNVISKFKINGHSIVDNLSNMMKFGFSAWGASNSPGAAEKDFNDQKTQLLELASSADANTIENVINEMERRSNWWIGFSTKQNARRSWAKSTKKGNEKNIELWKKFRSEVLKPFIDQFKSEGVVFNSKSVTESYTVMETQYDIAKSHSDKDAERNGSYTRNVYTLSLSPKLMAKAGIKQANGVPPVPTVENQSNTTMYLIIGAVLIALFGKNIKKQLK